jgi:hypothetical protein
MLMVQLGSDNTQRGIAGIYHTSDSTTNSTATANVQAYGNTAYGTASGQSTTNTTGMDIPITTFRRAAKATASLFDNHTEKDVWDAEISTTAHDQFGGSDEGMAKETASRLVKELRANHLIR